MYQKRHYGIEIPQENQPKCTCGETKKLQIMPNIGFWYCESCPHPDGGLWYHSPSLGEWLKKYPQYQTHFQEGGWMDEFVNPPEENANYGRVFVL